ncbi:MAG: endonuclease/exonuclease/phosphatase family protein [Anaerolineae bacterium]
MTDFRKQSIWVALGLPAITILIGMQTLRVLLPSLVFVLRDRIGWNAIQLGELAFAIFLTGFLTALLRRLLGPGRLLALTAGGLGLLRLAIQLWTRDPLGDLYLAIAGTVLFVLFLPTYLGRVRDGGSGRFALGFLLGLALDTAMHGAFGTYDVSWQAGVGPTLLVFLLVLIQWLLLAVSLRSLIGDTSSSASDGPLWPTLAWLAVGPFLFLQMLIFQNVARLTALTGWTQPLAFGCVLLGHAAGLALAAWVLSEARRGLWPLVLLLALGLVFSVVPAAPAGIVAASLFLAGQMAMAALLTVILASLDTRGEKAGLARTTIAHGLGMVLLAALLFLYYGAYDIALPFSNTVLPPAAALVVALCAVGAALVLPALPAFTPIESQPAVLVLLLLTMPLVRLVTWHTPMEVVGDGYPARIMTFNLHNGFDTDGFLGMEALARVIESEQPDVVALQEVSRGWVIDGSLDMLTWLSQRLDMPYVSGPTADPLWGNAILSRLPIIEYEPHNLPPRDLLILRGFLWARVDVGQGERLEVIATHYHHPETGSTVRVEQSKAILEFWAGRPHTAWLGDLNGRPGDPEIELLRQAGFSDVLDLAGISPGYTNPSDRPRQRIDYIWINPDLTASDVAITTGTASDHLGVVATIH